MGKDFRAELFAQRLLTAAEKKDPFSFAIICYQSIRESPLFNEYKDAGDKKKMEELVKSSIVDNGVILKETMGWDEEEVHKFFEHIIEFIKEI